MSYAQFKKEVTRFTYIAIICLLPWILSKTPEVLATLIHTFRNPYFGLHIKINRAFEREDYDTVQANIKKFHQWEEKRRQNARVVYTARTAEYYQSLLYEARGDYFQAIELRVAWKGRLYPFGGILSTTSSVFLVCFIRQILGRRLLKNFVKRQSRRRKCMIINASSLITEETSCLTILFLGGIQKRLLRGRNILANFL